MVRLFVALVMLMMFSSCVTKKNGVLKNDYVVLASKTVQADAEWLKVVKALQDRHQAEVFFYDKAPGELLEQLKEVKPRYVGIVEKPENLNRDYVIDLNLFSRELDEDIYADFLWGVITGYDAAGAMKMLENSKEPLVIKSAFASIAELNSAKWFDRFAWWDDQTPWIYGEKKGVGERVRIGKINDEESALKKVSDLYQAYDPDLVVTAWHATERDILFRFTAGNLYPKDGKLHALYQRNGNTWVWPESGKRKVYFAVGNCLIGNVNNTKESMAIAWMNGGNAATMVGYVVTTWHGRNGWGGLKYWLANSGRYTLAEAIYLNQQDFLHQQNEWYPTLIKEKYPTFEDGEFEKAHSRLSEVMKGEITNDHIGFWHDRDVVAYYGDPKWNVRLQDLPDDRDFVVTTEVKGKKCEVTIQTKENFNLIRMQGGKFKEEHVLNLPFNYFFPERLNNPRLAAGQDWKVAVDENFLLIYNADFKPNMTYKIVLDID